MKTNELMIGDWVYIADDDMDSRFSARVEAIDMLENIYAKVPGDKTAYPYSVDCAEPIPLSKEMLEKNGFVYTEPETTTMSEDNVWQVKDNDNQVFIEIEEQMDDNLLNYYIGYFMHGVNSCEIYFKHVHELQNILRLYNIDLEIIL